MQILKHELFVTKCRRKKILFRGTSRSKQRKINVSRSEDYNQLSHENQFQNLRFCSLVPYLPILPYTLKISISYSVTPPMNKIKIFENDVSGSPSNIRLALISIFIKVSGVVVTRNNIFWRRQSATDCSRFKNCTMEVPNGLSFQFLLECSKS